MLNVLRNYFSLEAPVFGGKGGAGVKSQFILFTGVAAGSIGQWAFSGLRNGHFVTADLLVGLIASIVIFPTIFQKAGLNKVKVNFVKWCVAFQNGFFWPALLQQIHR